MYAVDIIIQRMKYSKTEFHSYIPKKIDANQQNTNIFPFFKMYLLNVHVRLSPAL